jgi:DNA ligase (NAD+)
MRVLDKMRTGNEKIIHEPVKCPVCGSPVKKKEISDKKQGASVAIFCTNPNCYAQQTKNLIHFVSKAAFDINGMGEKIVETLIDEGLIKNPADIFTLTQGDLEPLERFAEKSADKLVTAISDAKNISLSRFINALGIRHVGEETAVKLAENFGGLEKIKKAELEDLEKIEDVGPQVASSIYEYFHNKANLKTVDELINNGVKIGYQSKKSGKLTGKTFVITGSLDTMSREDAKEKIRELGGQISESVSAKTSYVLVGHEPGSKFAKAKKLGVKTIDEKDFLKIIKI